MVLLGDGADGLPNQSESRRLVVHVRDCRSRSVSRRRNLYEKMTRRRASPQVANLTDLGGYHTSVSPHATWMPNSRNHRD